MLNHEWNPDFNAPRAESGTSRRWTSLQEGGRAMWKIARSAANRMSCGLSTTIPQENSSSPRNWSEKSIAGCHLPRHSRQIGPRVIVASGRDEYGGPHDDGLQRRQNGGAQHGDHTVRTGWFSSDAYAGRCPGHCGAFAVDLWHYPCGPADIGRREYHPAHESLDR